MKRDKATRIVIRDRFIQAMDYLRDKNLANVKDIGLSLGYANSPHQSLNAIHAGKAYVPDEKLDDFVAQFRINKDFIYKGLKPILIDSGATTKNPPRPKAKGTDSKVESHAGKTRPSIGIIMGSNSDLRIMQSAADFLKDMDILFEMTVVSAHRTPERMFEYAGTARNRGLKVIIAGAGGAAHLPGMVASLTSLPVIGVPIKSSNSIDGWDSVLSILQMPAGVPVATVALDGARNAGILAAQILGSADANIAEKLDSFKMEMKEKVMTAAAKMEGVDK